MFGSRLCWRTGKGMRGVFGMLIKILLSDVQRSYKVGKVRFLYFAVFVIVFKISRFYFFVFGSCPVCLLQAA